MQYNIIPIKKEYTHHKISKKIYNLLKNSPELQNTYSLLASLCCYDRNSKKIIFYHNPTSNYCYFLDFQLTDAYIFFIKNFINEKYISTKIAFQLLLIADEIFLDQKDFFRLFNILHWPSSKKGIDYFNAMKKFSDKLKDKIFQNKMSLKEAYHFNKVFLNDYDGFLSLLPKNLTFSQVNEVISNIYEYSTKKNKNINVIIKKFKNIDDKSFVTKSNNLRYPLYLKYLSIFDSFIKSLKLPKGAKVIFDKTFEKEEYTIEVKYQNITSLLNKIKQIKQSLENYLSDDDNIDLFDHKKLFKKYDKTE